MWKQCRQFATAPREQLMETLAVLERLGALTDAKTEKANGPGRPAEIRVLHPDYHCEDQEQFDGLCLKLVASYRATIVKPCVRLVDYGPLRVLTEFVSVVPHGGGTKKFKACEVIDNPQYRVFFMDPSNGLAPVVPLTDRSTVACQALGCRHVFNVADGVHDPSLQVVRINERSKSYFNCCFLTYEPGHLIYNPAHVARLLEFGAAVENPLNYVECPKCGVPFDYEPWARFLEPRLTVPLALAESPPAADVGVQEPEPEQESEQPVEPQAPVRAEPPVRVETPEERKQRKKKESSFFKGGHNFAAEKVINPFR
jgi:hypothetical protein